MNESRGEVRVAEWRELPADSRKAFEVFLTDYRTLPIIWKSILIPGALLGPFLAIAFFHLATVSLTYGPLFVLAVGHNISDRMGRRILRAECWRDGYSVRVALSRYKVKYAEDVGALRFHDDFLVFEGQRTTFSFDCSALREWADVYSQLPSSVSIPFLLLETPGKPIGIAFESIEPERWQCTRAEERILEELRKLRTRRSKHGIVNVLPPLDPLLIRKRVPLFVMLALIGIAVYFPLLIAFDSLHNNLLFVFLGPVLLLGAFLPWQMNPFETKKSRAVFAQLRSEADEVRRGQPENTVVRASPTTGLVGPQS